MSTKINWEPYLDVELGKITVTLPLITTETGFRFYSFNMMGQAEWNRVAGQALYERLAASSLPFDYIITPEAKAIGLAEEVARLMEHTHYTVLRKSRKLYMKDALQVSVKSVTTDKPQLLFLDPEDARLLKGKTVCLLDDVLSTGGTVDAVQQMAEAAGFTISAICCALTEGSDIQEYKGIPITKLNHIPLPGMN
ncbi:MAG: phosphoribosyltransferase family protein [Lachnospiraceae bacterium]